MATRQPAASSYNETSSNNALDVRFFADVFRESAVPSVIIGPDSTVLFWNAAAERLFGWTSEELIGRTLPLVPPDAFEEHLRLRKRTLEGQGFTQHRITRLAKDGRPIELSLSTWPVRGPDGRVNAIIGIYSDVSAEEVRFREALVNERLQELEQLYATAPIGLGFFDTDLHYIRVNERLAQMDGMPVEAHIGKGLSDVVPDVASKLEGIYREVLTTGSSVIELEFRAETPAIPGMQRDWQVSIYPFKHPDGTLLGATVAVSDITERKRLNDELKRQEMLLRLVIDSCRGWWFMSIAITGTVSRIALTASGSKGLLRISPAKE